LVTSSVAAAKVTAERNVTAPCLGVATARQSQQSATLRRLSETTSGQHAGHATHRLILDRHPAKVNDVEEAPEDIRKGRCAGDNGRGRER
jgi:hypothetical protein